MEIKDKICVVTGAASGIGKALCHALAAAGAKKVVCVDLNEAGAQETASEINGKAYAVNVGVEDQIADMIADVEANVGPIGIFASNAGIATPGGMDAPNEDWQQIWEVNVMSQVWAARHLIPLMVERGEGYIVNTASAAGLLNQVGSAPYGVTKHASVGLSEWLAFSHYDQGIRVSVLCPQAVRTEMTRGHEEHVAAIDGMLEPEDVAKITLEAIEDERFLILPHEHVLGYMRAKTENYDRWIGGMRKLNRKFGVLPDQS